MPGPTHALVFEGVRQLRWQPWPVSEPGPGWARLRTRAVGVCGSDIHGYLGESGRRTPPLVMGHEAVGVVEATGPDIDPNLLGRRCAVQPIVSCSTCDECRAGEPQLCSRREFLGGSRDGAMGDRFLAPASALFPLPDSLGDAVATLIEPAAVALHAVRRGGLLRGKSVLVCGAGAIGLLTALAAQRAGAARVAITDIDPFHRETAAALQIGTVLDPASPADAERVAASACDVAFDAVGIAATYNGALHALRRRGTLVAIGGWTSVQTPLTPLVTGELTVTGTFNYTPDEFGAALGWLAAAPFDASRLITQRRPLAEGAEVFAQLGGRSLNSVRTVLVPAA